MAEMTAKPKRIIQRLDKARKQKYLWEWLPLSDTQKAALLKTPELGARHNSVSWADCKIGSKVPV